MRIVCQRVTQATCFVDQQIVGQIQHGLLLFVGFTHEDTLEQVMKAAQKIIQLRIFEDDNEKMNLDIEQVKGDILSISQFTLYANTQNGNRPSFTEALDPAKATILYDVFNDALKSKGVMVATGVFGAHMVIDSVNDGPVTLTFTF